MSSTYAAHAGYSTPENATVTDTAVKICELDPSRDRYLHLTNTTSGAVVWLHLCPKSTEAAVTPAPAVNKGVALGYMQSFICDSSSIFYGEIWGITASTANVAFHRGR